MIGITCSSVFLGSLYIGKGYLKNYLASNKKCGSYFSLVETLYRSSVTSTL